MSILGALRRLVPGRKVCSIPEDVRFARLLLAEIALYHGAGLESALTEGRTELVEDLERACRMYSDHTGPSAEARLDFWNEARAALGSGRPDLLAALARLEARCNP